MTSMTKNTFDLEPFYERFLKYHSTKPLPSCLFLQWFLGFVEGDGSLAILNKHLILGEQTLVLNINVDKKDKHVLDFIQVTFGFGKVYKNVKNLYTYRIGNMRDISIIIELFNRNTVIPKFYERFVCFLEKYNEKILNIKARPQTKALGPVQLKPFTVRPTLDDAWFSGFTDAEGCFHENVSKATLKRKQWSYFFAVYQSGTDNVCVLKHFKSVFKCGTIQHTKRSDEYIFKVISCNHSVDILGPYFQKFPLITVKKEAFKQWLLVMTVLKEHRYRRSDLNVIYAQIAKNTSDVNKK